MANPERRGISRFLFFWWFKENPIKINLGLDLMSLKSVSKSSATNRSKSSSSFISRQSGGLCIDFNPRDSNVYLVGTEEGMIHRCSSSYNEQYLDSYAGHTRPVYRIRWSPFLAGVFLSCSADWTIRLWNQESESEMFKFQSGKVIIIAT